MECSYFDAGRCRSCTLMGQPHPVQLGRKDAHTRELLGPVPGLEWLAPFAGAERGFRNRAKMVVGGSWRTPTLGILDAEGHGVDLRGCGVIDPAITAALPAVALFITAARLVPYSVPMRSGELKHVLVTCNPDGQLLLRFVVRSEAAVEAVCKHLPALLRRLPQALIVTANLLPEHKAALEGETEVHLHGPETLPMPVGPLRLRLRPQGFFQTNTEVADALYRQGAAWVDELAPASVWDLYSGVGGFALSSAGPRRTVVGVEISPQAVEGAKAAALDSGVSGVDFLAADATAFAEGSSPREQPELVIVNPPRRGLGERLCSWLESSSVGAILYSSCNAETLAEDLRRMPGWRPVRARVMDMFPQTEHYEVITLLERAA
ncbi:23S rRNA (uracil(747)-C(5))-methyltransferase RlmC [Galactobacter valiniphilus]|uniref:23S rRNA (uracil(747)-C(5))-methyltransferase RlmC n=1 Tax=Galactobacter valiniphilus TaxID=2676122 RepID=UPI00373695E1